MGRLATFFPILLALLFGAYAYGLIANNLETYQSLTAKETARIVEDTGRHAATIGDYLGEQRRFVAELAQGPEIDTYLTNQALGMSLHYGLQTSLDAIGARFAHTIKARRIGTMPLYSRFAYIDEHGRRLVDTQPRAPLPPPTVAATIRIDLETATALIGVPVLHNGRPAGHLFAWSDLGELVRFLLPPAQIAPYRVHLLIAGEQRVQVAGQPGLDPAAIAAIAAIGEGRAGSLPAGEDRPPCLIVRAAVPGIPPLSLATVVSQAVLSESRPIAFLVIASLVPPVSLIATVYLARLRRRQARTALELRTSQQRVMTISDTVVEGIVMIDHDERVAFVNRPALRILDLPGEPAGYLGQPLANLFALEGAETAPWLATIADGATRLGDDATLRSASGRVVAAAYGCAAMIDAAEGRTALLSFRDIGQLKQAKAEAMQAARLASIGQLAAGIAHEINTPAQYIGDNLAYIADGLTSLTGTALAGKALAEQVGSGGDLAAPAAAVLAGCGRKFNRLLEELPAAVAESRDGVAQIARIVLSMKEFSHPGASANSAVDLNHALETTLTVSRNAWKRVAEIERHYAADLPPVSCQPGAINQVLLNLILNAAQALEASGKSLPGRIILTTRAGEGRVVVEVADTGTGIPAAIRERIFDPFFTTKPVGKGTGQGLAICLDIVHRHGGRLEAGGVEGDGAVFTLSLPLNPSA
ncbi:sensor histidine kinase [Phaeospirillum tilakii]|uniref:histidine kinase n=1 Tax=Phaeospirillum tilakii TaxID=741673 RepID=A0ABW5CGI4_9PROT